MEASIFVLGRKCRSPPPATSTISIKLWLPHHTLARKMQCAFVHSFFKFLTNRKSFPSEKQTKERAPVMPPNPRPCCRSFISCCLFWPLFLSSCLKFILTVLWANNYPRKKKNGGREDSFSLFCRFSRIKGFERLWLKRFRWILSHQFFMNESILFLCLPWGLAVIGPFLTSENQAWCLVILGKRII